MALSTFLSELSLRSSVTLNRFRFTDFVDRDTDHSGNTIPGVPDRMFFLSLYAATSQGIYLMPSWRYTGRMAMNDANSRFNNSWPTADLVAGYKPRMPNRLNLDIFVRINNLFDEKYASMILVNAPSFGSNPPRYYYPGLPRHFIVGLRMGV